MPDVTDTISHIRPCLPCYLLSHEFTCYPFVPLACRMRFSRICKEFHMSGNVVALRSRRARIHVAATIDVIINFACTSRHTTEQECGESSHFH